MLNHLTLANVRSYADACETIALRLIDLQEDGFRNMVVPSRGAAPLADAASAYFHSVWKYTHTDPADRIKALMAHTFGPMVSPLYLPFTADIPPEITGVESRDIRRFWSAVLAAFASGDHASPYFRFYRFLRAEVCKVGFAHRLEREVMGPKFVFLDTVVSGRAVHEIMDAFDEFGLTECHFILVADEMGNRIKPEHRLRIDAMVAAGRATLVPMASLFTEDQGPSVSGIWSVTMPALMEVARDAIPAFRRDDAIGAGLYYHEVQARDDGSNAAATVSIGSLGTLINSAFRGVARDSFIERELESLRSHFEAHKILRPETTLTMAEPVLNRALTTKATLGTSSSHALRVTHDKDVAAKLLRLFKP